jgi:DNA cross-link repair 1A protein
VYVHLWVCEDRFEIFTLFSRYEVPYSEHCSFTELRDFVKLVSPINVIPSVNNEGEDSANTMVSLLLS